MKFTDQQKSILFAKLGRRHNPAQYFGCVTSTEVVYLVSIGCKPVRGSERTVEWAKEEVKTGKIYGYHWFYFFPPKDLNKFPHDKVHDPRPDANRLRV